MPIKIRVYRSKRGDMGQGDVGSGRMRVYMS